MVNSLRNIAIAWASNKTRSRRTGRSSAHPGALVHEGDFFTWATETGERFECAAGNPPFIRYQTFKGEVRRRAIDLCLDLGARFNGLASSWAPFIVATAGLLKRGGRMAFVVPAEIGHAPYAAPLLDYLVANFAHVQVVAVRQKLFPTLSEDCWLLYAEGFGGKATTLDLTIVDTFMPAKTPPEPTFRIDLDEWRNVWNRRLRPYLLPTFGARALCRCVGRPRNAPTVGLCLGRDWLYQRRQRLLPPSTVRSEAPRYRFSLSPACHSQWPSYAGSPDYKGDRRSLEAERRTDAAPAPDARSGAAASCA